MIENPPPAPSPKPAFTLTPDQQNWLKFAIGFVGWYLLNGLFWLAVGGASGNYGYNMALGIFTLPANIIVLIVLTLIRRTRWVAVGIGAALAVNFIISLFLGVVFNAMCLFPFFSK